MSMLSQVLGWLNTYLLPLVLVVPLVLLIFALVHRRPDADPDANPGAAPADGRADQTVLPVARAGEPLPSEARDAPEPAPAAPAASPAPLVLVVDDSAVVRARLHKLLGGRGYRVEVARDGREALAVLAGARFSLLITDLEMPTMDGFELIAAVTGMLETEDLPIIAITGHDDLHARVHLLKGIYGLFKKPWNDRELLARVDTLVALPRLERSTAAPPRPSATPATPR